MKELRGILNEIERWTELNSKIERLQAALRQIDSINNNASIFNVGIHDVVAKELGDPAAQAHNGSAEQMFGAK